MKSILFLGNLYLLLALFSISLGCLENNAGLSTQQEILTSKQEPPTKDFEVPTRNHDLSYIPYDAKVDDPTFIICDSTGIKSGRNRLRAVGGRNKFREDITADYLYKPEYAAFTGFIVIRFLVNCEDKSGRYRAESLHLDFSPLNAPPGLLEHAIDLVKGLDNWTKSTANDPETEYSKFINLKINNGKLEHVLF